MGHQEVLDHMFFDGLQNPYDGNMMGYFAEETARNSGPPSLDIAETEVWAEGGASWRN